MPRYRLLISFDVKPPDGSPFPESYDETKEFNDLTAAETELESVLTVMVSRYSDQGFQWTLIEKCVVLQEEKSDLTTLML